MNNKKSLPRLTDPNEISNLRELKSYFGLPKITRLAVDAIPLENRKAFDKAINRLANTLKDQEYDRFCDAIEPLVDVQTKNATWQFNHYKIICAIERLMLDAMQFPMVQELADETGLSRQTIHKHLKDFPTHPAKRDLDHQLILMTEPLLVKIYKRAAEGSIPASKLYLQYAFKVREMLEMQLKRENDIADTPIKIAVNGSLVQATAFKKLPLSDQQKITKIVKRSFPETVELVE